VPLTFHEALNDATPLPPPRQCRVPASSATVPVDGGDDIERLRSGDSFLGFELVEELGRGTFARVFLARQQSLAGRQVVLKISRRPTREAERLARLQHTHVVPVYSVHNQPPLQVICMPYLGRRTIADVLRQYRRQSPHASVFRTSSLSWLRRWRTTTWGGSHATTLATPTPTTPASSQKPTPAAALPALLGQPKAVLHLLRQLSSGLQHAHEHGILHLDLKPANVLLADNGEPMLFDFNLSFDSQEQQRELIGGTLAYMAIEQLEDMRCRGRGHVDARTDLYALGVMAWELLTGEVPFPTPPYGLADFDQLIAVRRAPLPPLRQYNPAVTPAVEAIIRKLLAPDPADRYQSAAELKTDIERHLADLPLQYATEPSLRERLQKWRRRHPRLLRRLTISLSLLLAISTAALLHQYLQTQAVSTARDKYRSLIPLIQSAHIELLVHGDYSWQQQGQQHAFHVLQQYGLLYDPQWRERAEFRYLPPDEQQELIRDCADLLVLVVQSRWEDDRQRPEAIRAQAAAELLQLARYALNLYPPGQSPPLLYQQIRELTAALEGPTVAPAESPTAVGHNWRDHYLQAAADILADRFPSALQRLEALTAQRPQDGLLHFWIGFCQQQLGRNDNALDRYALAAVLLPHEPRPPFLRGVIYSQNLAHTFAEREYTQALLLAPQEPIYYRYRASSRWRLYKYEEAEEDLQKALQLAPGDIQAHLYRAWVHSARGDPRAAHAHLQAAFTHKPLSANDYVVRGLQLLKSRPKTALVEFRAAEALNPRSAVALYNQVHIHLAMKQLDLAHEAAQRLIDHCPQSALGWTTYALVLAKMQRRSEAHTAVQQALSLSQDINIILHCAGVLAETSRTTPQDAQQAIQLLQQAFQLGLRRTEWLDNDMYASLRSHPGFQQLVSSAQQLFNTSRAK
jgi:serine/threonine protein kinase/Flp pilus assembly protein TadD